MDALVDKPGNNSHIFRVDQKCAVFDERSIDIGCTTKIRDAVIHVLQC